MNPYEEVETPLAHVDVVTEGKKLRAHQDAMQKKTFTKWYNSYLQQRNLKVDDLFKDVGDGLILHNLVELLAQEKNPQKAQQNPRFTAQKLENIQAALNHIKRKGVAVESIGSSEIANGSEVFVLGLSWMLILRFEVQKFSADTQELLRWCKRRTADYPNVKVDNFTTSFQDGLALNALIHKHAPELIDYESLDPSNTLANIQNALDVAERELGVPKLLDANDLMNTPEEKSVITYVARLRDALSTREEQFKLEEMKADEEARKKAAEEQARKKAADEEARLLAAEQARKKAEEDARLRAEAEARRKAEEEAARLAAEEAARKRAEEAARRKAEDDERRMAADRNKSIEELNDLLPQFVNREKQELETDKLVADYNLRAKKLADWIHQRDDKLKDNVNHNKLGDTLEEVEGNIDHLRDDVDQKEKEKLDLETLNNAINTRLKMENRPRPVHEVPMEQVNNLWNQASTTEQGYKKLLLDRREELLKQQVSLDRFRRFASKLEDWTTVCAEVISRAELGESIVDTTELIAEHERFSRDSKAQARTYKELGSIAKLLPGHPEVEERMRKLRSFFDPLPQRNKDRADQLQKELVRQRQIEANRLKFFEDIRDFEELLFAAEEYARNPLESDTEQAIIAVLDPLKRVASSIKPHEHFSAEEEAELNEARARYEGVAPQLEARQSAVKEDQQRKKQVEELYQKFARTSAQFATWYSKMAALIAEDGTIELLRQRAKSVQTGLGEGQTHLNNASTQQASIDSSGLVGPNPYTTATVYSLTTQFDHIKKWADDRAERMQANPPVTNHQQVVRALDVLSHDKGVINPQELSSVLPAESVDYLKRKAPANASGEVEYTKFNPYPEDTFVQRRSSTVSSGSRLSLVGSPSITPLSPQEQPKRNSVYSAPSKNRTSVHATGGQTPVISATTPVSTQASPMLTSPVIKPVSEENGAPLPHFDDSMRKRKELEENLYLYTTQTLTSPLAIRYEVEVDKHEHIEFRVSFDGSNNIRLLRPTNAFNMLAVTEVPAFKTKVVAIVQQIDPYQEASLKNKYSWSSRVI